MASGLAPHRLLLELTESAMIDDYGLAAERLTEIRSMGVRIALDDFGAGYTSLRQLQSFPVDVVKLDQSFINTTMAHDVGVLNGLVIDGELARARDGGRGDRGRRPAVAAARGELPLRAGLSVLAARRRGDPPRRWRRPATPATADARSGDRASVQLKS